MILISYGYVIRHIIGGQEFGIITAHRDTLSINLLWLLRTCSISVCTSTMFAVIVHVQSKYGNNYDVIKWKRFPRYWPFVRGIHQSPANSPQRPVTRSFDVLFDQHRNKQLGEQSRRWWFETPLRSLRRHHNNITFCRRKAWMHRYVQSGSIVHL